MLKYSELFIDSFKSLKESSWSHTYVYIMFATWTLNMNDDPYPSIEWTLIDPPIASLNLLQIVSPKPIPSRLALIEL
jgi:hypothetical protein